MNDLDRCLRGASGRTLDDLPTASTETKIGSPALAGMPAGASGCSEGRSVREFEAGQSVAAVGGLDGICRSSRVFVEHRRDPLVARTRPTSATRTTSSNRPRPQPTRTSRGVSRRLQASKCRSSPCANGAAVGLVLDDERNASSPRTSCTRHGGRGSAMRRKSGDARTLDKLVGAYGRAANALDEAEQALKDAEASATPGRNASPPMPTSTTRPRRPV